MSPAMRAPRRHLRPCRAPSAERPALRHATQIRPDLPGFGAVARTGVESGHSQRFSPGAQFLVEEHVFVPDGAQPGWIRGTALDFVQRTTVLSCFAADDLAAGPVAQARLPYALPPGLHGAFVPAWGETPSARCRRRRLTGQAAGRAGRAEARIDDAGWRRATPGGAGLRPFKPAASPPQHGRPGLAPAIGHRRLQRAIDEPVAAM